MATRKDKPQIFDPSIIEGPIHKAVWKLAWPSMLQNAIAGLQGIVDHTLVGRYVGFTGNAAIGVSWYIFLVVIVFIGSVFTGQAILVARLAGAGDAERVNRVVYQGFLTAFMIVLFIMVPAGVFLAPEFLSWIRTEDQVRAEALPYLRTLLTFSAGMIFYFMMAGALRSAGDARTPLRLGILMTGLNLCSSVILIRGFGPIPAFGTLGAALGTVISAGIVGLFALYLLFSQRLVIRFPKGMSWRPDWQIIRQLFSFGLPTGFQGIAMNLAGVLLIGFVGALPHSAESQAAYAVCYTQLFSLITWTSVGLMGAVSAVVGQNLGAGRPIRSKEGARRGALLGLSLAAAIGSTFLIFPGFLLGLFGIQDQIVMDLGQQLLAYLSISGLLVTVAVNYTGALQGAGDTRSPLFITAISQLAVPPTLLFLLHTTRGLQPEDVWRAILLGHFLRCILSALRFHQGRWTRIKVALKDA